MTTAYAVSENSTRGLTAGDSTAFWRDHVTLNQGALNFGFPLDSPFWGSTIVQRAGGYQLIEYSSGAVSYVRTPRQARADDDRSLRFLVPGSGAILVEGEQSNSLLRPGAMAVLQMTSSFSLHHEAGTHAWILSAPEGTVPGTLALEEPLQVDVQHGLGALAASTVRNLSRQRATLLEHDFVELSRHVCDLFATCAGRQSPSTDATIESTARQVVRAHAHDPALTPTTLAGELGWSLRRVQTALERAGTTAAELIRSTRLDLALAALQESGRLDQPISQIAYDCGFGSLSGFHAAFRDRYGETPREVRSRSREP